jgi:5'-nucleotidase (lipoprotein e(P4) family)
MNITGWRFLAMVASLGILAGGCAAKTQTTVAPAAPATPATASSSVAAPSAALHWVRDSAEYRALSLQAYGAATRHVEAVVPGRPAGSWAVVLDADETVIDNTQYEKERYAAGLQHDEGRWNAWVERRAAGPVPGAKAFLERVKALGGVVAIVTNRADAVCEATRDNLRSLGMPFDVVLCKPEGQSDKNPRFESVAAGTAKPGLGPTEVVAFVGDNIRDFPKMDQKALLEGDAAFAEFGRRFYVIPNPLYGSWEANPHR